MKKWFLALISLVVLMSISSNSDAMMHGGSMMNNDAGFGMMNGMAGAPVVGEDGTAYFVSFTPTSDPGTVPGSTSFQSNLIAYQPNGESASLTLNGIVSRPVVEGSVLAATASLPDFSNYMMFGNYGDKQSVLYAVALPLSESSVPAAVAMDGQYASVPVIVNNLVYVTTTDFGNAMMGSNTFQMFGNGNYDFNSDGLAKTYLYIFETDGTLVSRIEVK